MEAVIGILDIHLACGIVNEMGVEVDIFYSTVGGKTHKAFVYLGDNLPARGMSVEHLIMVGYGKYALEIYLSRG